MIGFTEEEIVVRIEIINAYNNYIDEGIKPSEALDKLYNSFEFSKTEVVSAVFYFARQYGKKYGVSIKKPEKKKKRKSSKYFDVHEFDDHLMYNCNK